MVSFILNLRFYIICQKSMSHFVFALFTYLRFLVKRYTKYRVIQKVTDKLQERIERSEYNNFQIGTHILRSNPESVQCLH